MTLKSWAKFVALFASIELILVGTTVAGFIGHEPLLTVLGPGYLITGAVLLVQTGRLYPKAKRYSDYLKAHPDAAATQKAIDLAKHDWRHRETPPFSMGRLYTGFGLCMSVLFIIVGPFVARSYVHDANTYTGRAQAVVVKRLPISERAITQKLGQQSAWDQMWQVQMTLPGTSEPREAVIGCFDRGRSADCPRVGDRVQVVYDTHNLSDVELAGEKTGPIVAGLLGLFSGACWIVLLLIIRQMWRGHVWKKLHPSMPAPTPPSQPVDVVAPVQPPTGPVVAAPTASQQQPAAGWYPESAGGGARWWDGQAWTSYTARETGNAATPVEAGVDSQGRLAMILGIISIPTLVLLGLGLLLAVPALIIGIKARRKDPTSAMALTGIICGAIAVAIGAFLGLIFALAALG